MDINQLRYFIEICKLGSMSKAANTLNISPQGISAAIRRLEDELMADLFIRSANGLELTESGKGVYAEVLAVIEHVDKIYTLGKLEAMGKASITVAITIGRFMKLPASLQKLLLTPPDEFSVSLVNEYSSTCMNMVLNDEAVFGMVYGVCSEKRFNVTELENVQQVFIVNKHHPLAKKGSIYVRDLDNVPMLMPEKRTVPGKAIVDLFAKNNIKLNLAYVCMVPHQAIDIVTKNENLVARTLRTDIREEDLENICVLDLLDYDFTMPFSLITKKGRKLSVHEQLFKHLMLDCYRVP